MGLRRAARAQSQASGDMLGGYDDFFSVGGSTSRSQPARRGSAMSVAPSTPRTAATSSDGSSRSRRGRCRNTPCPSTARRSSACCWSGARHFTPGATSGKKARPEQTVVTMVIEGGAAAQSRRRCRPRLLPINGQARRPCPTRGASRWSVPPRPALWCSKVRRRPATGQGLGAREKVRGVGPAVVDGRLAAMFFVGRRRRREATCLADRRLEGHCRAHVPGPAADGHEVQGLRLRGHSCSDDPSTWVSRASTRRSPRPVVQPLLGRRRVTSPLQNPLRRRASTITPRRNGGGRRGVPSAPLTSCLSVPLRALVIYPIGTTKLP